MTRFKFWIYCFAFITLLLTKALCALPLDTGAEAAPTKVEATATPIVIEVATEVPESVAVNEIHVTEAAPPSDLETGATEQKTLNAKSETSAPGNSDHSDVGNSMYATYLTPEAIQQYVKQFGAAYPGYAAAYPAPIGYAPAITASQPSTLTSGVAPIYPGPYVVQTGYEGYLVPATAPTADLKGNSQQNNNNNSNVLVRPKAFLTNLFSDLTMSALFRVVTAVLATIGMIFFSGALSKIICDFTPLCSAVEYFKNDKGRAERMGRMLVEGMTPERVRRAAEIVHDAIRKYSELQKLGGQ